MHDNLSGRLTKKVMMILQEKKKLLAGFLLAALFIFLTACDSANRYSNVEVTLPPATETPAPRRTAVQPGTAVPPTSPPLDPTYAAQIAAMRDPAIPDLPFPDNPDPSLCGIPTEWGDDGEAWITGIYEGELVQDPVLLYESHLRLQINGEAAHGARVQVLLYQQNPETNYYFVKVEGGEGPNEGWVPAPFLSFEPVLSDQG